MNERKIIGYKEILDYYGSVAKFGKALKITRQCVNRWGGVIPELRAYQLEVLTRGRGKLNFKAREYLKSDELKEAKLKLEKRLERAAMRKNQESNICLAQEI